MARTQKTTLTFEMHGDHNYKMNLSDISDEDLSWLIMFVNTGGFMVELSNFLLQERPRQYQRIMDVLTNHINSQVNQEYTEEEEENEDPIVPVIANEDQ